MLTIRSRGGLRSLVNMPSGEMIVLGKAPLMGALTGWFGVEVCSRGPELSARIWTLYDHSGQDVLTRIRNSFTKGTPAIKTTVDPHSSSILPYSRICADAPRSAFPVAPLHFWLDPLDELTQAAGLGSQWLLPLSFTPREGLILAGLNMHMLTAESMQQLQAAGLLIDHGNLEDQWAEPPSAPVLACS